MMDYLSGLAERSVYRTLDVRPVIRPQFGQQNGEVANEVVEEELLSSNDAAPSFEMPSNVNARSAVARPEGNTTDSWETFPETRSQRSIVSRESFQGDTEIPQHHQNASDSARRRESTPSSSSGSNHEIEPGPANPAFETPKTKPGVGSIRQDREQVERPSKLIHPEINKISIAAPSAPTRVGNKPSHRDAPVAVEQKPNGTSERKLQDRLSKLESIANERTGSTIVEKSIVETPKARETEPRTISSLVVERVREIIPLSATQQLPSHAVRSTSVNTPTVATTSETIVHVTIGRVEVRANVGQPKRNAGREAAQNHSASGLDDYLRNRTSGRSS